jgi:hypothetical protein
VNNAYHYAANTLKNNFILQIFLWRHMFDTKNILKNKN